MARISYVKAEEAPDVVRDEYARLQRERGTLGPLYQLLANNPAIMTRVIALGEAIRGQAKLDRRTQELAILRVGYLTQAVYEWAHHIRAARRVGVLEEQIADLPAWQESKHFNARERAALRCADEVTRDVRLSDEGFAELRRHFDEQEAMEVILTASYYNMICRFLRSTEVDLEPEYTEESETLPPLRG